MGKTFKIAKREYKASVRTKGFIVTLVVMPILMGGSVIGSALLENRGDKSDKKVVVVDRSGVVAPALVEAARKRNETEVYDESGKKTEPAYILEVVEPIDDAAAQRLELSDRIRRGEIHAFVDIGENVLHPGGESDSGRIRYHAENALLDEVREWMARPINNRLRRARLAEAGVDEASIPDLFSWLSVEGLGLLSRDEKTGGVRDAEHSDAGKAVGVPIAMMMLMFMMIMMGAIPLLNSVVEEKTQRIAEVILGSAKPFEFMAGKVIGGLAVSLTAAAVYVIGGIVVFRQLDLTQYIPYDMLPWFFVYMIAAIVMMGSGMAAIGAAVSDPKDAQSFVFIGLLPLMVPMFVMIPVIKEPLSGFATTLSLIPPFTPLLMLVRQSTPMAIPAWQPWVGLAGLLATTVLGIWAGGRIFRVGILMQGNPPRIGDFVRWAIKG